MTETIEIGEVEVDAEELEEALDRLPDETDTSGDSTECGSVIVAGDQYYDDDVHVANWTDGTISAVISVSTLRSRIEDTKGPGAVEMAESIVDEENTMIMSGISVYSTGGEGSPEHKAVVEIESPMNFIDSDLLERLDRELGIAYINTGSNEVNDGLRYDNMYDFTPREGFSYVYVGSKL